jgi:Kef-type K+ transport system membrane component KefB
MFFQGVSFVLIGMLVDPANILPTLPVALLISIVSMVKFFGGFIPIYLKEAQICDAITGGNPPVQGRSGDDSCRIWNQYRSTQL